MKEDARQLRCLLDKALAQVPEGDQTGILLSGGVDSSSLACILLSKRRKLRAVSASFAGWPMYDETEYIEMVKARYPHLETNYYTALTIDLVKELREHMQFCRHPIRTGTLLLQYQLFKMAQRLGIRYLIYGQFGDEVMGGYDLCFLSKAYDELKQGRIRDAFCNVREYVRRARLQKDQYIPLNIFRCLVTFGGMKKALPQLMRYMHYIVETSQKAADQFGIKLLLPYADPEIVSFCQQLNTDRLVYRGVNKVLLKEAVADIVPEGVLARSKKFCFYSPDALWFLQNRKQIELMPNPAIRREFRKFLRDPYKRRYYKLWMSLSREFMAPSLSRPAP